MGRDEESEAFKSSSLIRITLETSDFAAFCLSYPSPEFSLKKGFRTLTHTDASYQTKFLRLFINVTTLEWSLLLLP
jgi:hypothetical protein